MALDTVYDGQMRPAFVDEPAVVLRRLRAPYPESWTCVMVGDTRTVLTVSEYLYKDKWEGTVKMLEELMRKQSLPMYQKDPSRLRPHIERTARRILDMVSKENRYE